jgi:hypothetical protein
MNAEPAMPGERWLVNRQPVDTEPQETREVTVTLKDFDARTQTWSVEQDGHEGSFAVLAKHLIKRIA